jgi:hypothetical protein
MSGKLSSCLAGWAKRLSYSIFSGGGATVFASEAKQ